MKITIETDEDLKFEKHPDLAEHQAKVLGAILEYCHLNPEKNIEDLLEFIDELMEEGIDD